MSSSRIPPTTMPVLVIEYAETNDDPIDHQPIVPGFTDDGIFWACVARLPGGRTRWAVDSSNPRTRNAASVARFISRRQ